MSRKIDHKILENPPHLFGRQPGTRLVRLSQDRRKKGFCPNSKTEDLLAKIRTSKRLRSQRHITLGGRSPYGI